MLVSKQQLLSCWCRMKRVPPELGQRVWLVGVLLVCKLLLAAWLCHGDIHDTVPIHVGV